jgi:hypothetical protein
MMPKSRDIPKKIGRPEEIDLDDLDDLNTRYKDMKWFLENNWGRVSRRLKELNKPDDVSALFRSIPSVEWCKPFRGHALCLITEKITAVSPEEVRLTRRKWKQAAKNEEMLWTKYHEVSQRAQTAVTGLKAAISEFYGARGTLLFFQVVNIVSASLDVQDLTERSSQLLADVRAAQAVKNSLRQILNEQEGWFAQNEVVEFAKNRRYGKTLLNCARAFAGMPEWGWFHSRRTCEQLITKQPAAAAPYELFELLRKIARTVKPLKLSRIEIRLRAELLRPQHALLRGYLAPQWYYVQESIHHCIAIKRSEVPSVIMDRFMYHCDRPKTVMETEIARRNQLLDVPQDH